MKIRTPLLLILLGIMVSLTAMAYASPPDPSWVGGFFDDGDGDNVVVLITSNSAAVDPFPLDVLWPVPPNIVGVASAEEAKGLKTPLSGGDARAPPPA